MTGTGEEQGPTGPLPSTKGIPTNQVLEYWRILIERRMVVVTCIALSVISAMTLTFLMTPIYRAVTTIEIERTGPEILEFTDVVSVDPAGYKDFYQTQYMLLQSQAIFRLTAEGLDLPNRPEFAARQETPVTRLATWTKERIFGPAAEEDPFDAAVEFIEENLRITPVRNSYLVKISFEDGDRRLAQEIVNGVASAYHEFQMASRYDTTDKANKFLRKDVKRVQDEIKGLEQQLQDYASEKDLLNLGEGTHDISEQALSAINARCVEAASQLAAAEARYTTAQGAPAEALPQVQSSPTLAHLRREYDALERRHVEISKRFQADWPPRAQLREQLDTTRSQIKREIDNIAIQVRAVSKNDYLRSKAELERLVSQRDRQRQEVQRVNRAKVEYASLRAEIDSKREILHGLIGRQNETQASFHLKESSTSNIRVVDLAGLPKEPVSPRKAINFLLSLVFGLTLGVGLALTLDYLDNTVKSELDLQRVGLTVLGHVPLIPALRLVESDDAETAGTKPTFQGDTACHVDPRSGFAEAFRNLRTSLLLASPDRPPRSMTVTSCQPGDGKSTTAMNMAIVLTQLGRRVLLVDADLRRARLHKALDVPNDLGLSSFLSGNNPIEDLPQDTEIPNLNVITSGPLPPNPSELLNSPRLDELLKHFLDVEGFDHVIFDSPPLLAVTDAMILSSRLESTVVVVRSGVTRREALGQAVGMLSKARAPIVGSVLNAVSEEAGYYYGGSYRYGPYSNAKFGYYSQESDATSSTQRSSKGSRRRVG